MSRLLAGMLAVVDFNNQSLLTTNKIYDIGSNRLLADKLGARERTSAQSIPQFPFRFAGIPSQSAGAIRRGSICVTHTRTPPHPTRFARRSLPARGERKQLGLGMLSAYINTTLAGRAHARRYRTAPDWSRSAPRCTAV